MISETKLQLLAEEARGLLADNYSPDAGILATHVLDALQGLLPDQATTAEGPAVGLDALAPLWPVPGVRDAVLVALASTLTRIAGGLLSGTDEQRARWVAVETAIAIASLDQRFAS